MDESDVKKRVSEFLRGRGFFVPEKEFHYVPGRGLERGARPDVAGFRWQNDFEVEAVAVECKASASPRYLMETALGQAREYQLVFPYVYLAVPALKEENLRRLEYALRSLAMGLYVVKDDEVVEKWRAGVSLRLDYHGFLFKVRQVAAGILTYVEVVGKPDIYIPYPGVLHCYQKEEPANFLLGNFMGGRDYYFGFCLEKKDNVRRLSRFLRDDGEFSELFGLISSLPEEYMLLYDNVHTYRPREVSWALVNVRARDLSSSDFRKLLEYSRERNWRTRLIIWRKVWDEEEVLSRQEHEKRVREAKKELIPIREKIIESSL